MIIAEVCMVGIDKYWFLSTLEEVVPIPEAAHNGQEFSVVNGVILFSIGKFLGVETAGVSWLVLPRLGSEPARRAEAGHFATRLTGPILGKVAVPMTVDST